MLALLLALALQDPAPARAESLLAAGDSHYARAVIGRYAALDAYRAAARLAPANPEPLYRQAAVGFYLGSDEGEGIAREALLQLFALDPDYRDSWERFTRLYWNDDIARRADAALARHPDHVAAVARRAELALVLGAHGRGDSLARLVLARRPGHVPAYLILARLHFETARDADGFAWYDSATTYAGRDSTDALWDVVWMIATPAEARRYAATLPGERPRFFAWFWAKRDPNLLTAENERIAEHFRRLAEARRRFRLLHPLSLFHRSPAYRALAAAGARTLLGGDVLTAEAAAAEPGGTALARAALDARGLLWVRHGAPDERHGGLDVERWVYRSPEGPRTITLARGTGGLPGNQLGGDYVFVPVSARQAHGARVLLGTDRTTLPAALAARAWTATFNSHHAGLTDVYVRTSPETAAVALWDGADDVVARDAGPGVRALAVPPGRYGLGLDVQSAGALARLRGELVVPRYALGGLALSSVVLAPADSVAGRAAVLAGMPADLVYPAGAPLACYAEVYGLSADTAGRVRYRVRYTFEPVVPFVRRLLGGSETVAFEFEREAPAAATIAERLVLDPGRVPPGRYRVTLAVTDLRPNVKSASVAVDITLR